MGCIAEGRYVAEGMQCMAESFTVGDGQRLCDVWL